MGRRRAGVELFKTWKCRKGLTLPKYHCGRKWQDGDGRQQVADGVTSDLLLWG